MKKILLSLLICLTLIPIQSTFAQNSITIDPEDKLSDYQLRQIAQFLDDFHIVQTCLRNRRDQESKPMTAFMATCFALQVFDTDRLTRRSAWEKALKIDLIASETRRTAQLDTLGYLRIIFQAAGVGISPISELKYRKTLRSLRLSLPRADFKTLAIAIENGIIKEPGTINEARALKRQLNETIDIAQGLAYLYQIATSQHEEAPIITITPYVPPESTISLEATLKEIINTIKTQSYFNRYFDEEKAMEAAIKALVDTLKEDKYIEYYTVEEYKNFSTSLNGNLEGIGAYIEERDDLIIIVSPIEGSPAAKAGLLPEDIITHIDGESTEGMSLQEAVSNIRGPKGTVVRLTIDRDGEVINFSITRGQITIPALSTESRDGFEIIKLVQFSSSSANEMKDALEAAVANNPRGIIIDLRNNPGGFLNEVVTIVDYFTDKGDPIVWLKDRFEKISIDGNLDPIVSGIPISILINKGSASASEILAGTLQSYGIARVYGEISFGKGTVQNILTLHDPSQYGVSAFKLTTAEYLIPLGSTNSFSIDGVGVKPLSNPYGEDTALLDDRETLDVDEALETVIDLMR